MPQLGHHMGEVGFDGNKAGAGSPGYVADGPGTPERTRDGTGDDTGDHIYSGGAVGAFYGNGGGAGGAMFDSPAEPARRKRGILVKTNRVSPELPLGAEASLGGVSSAYSRLTGSSAAPPAPAACGPPKDPYEIHFPNMSTRDLEDVVMSVVWRVGRHFGFQAFNANPKTLNMRSQEHVPATIFVAADHLNFLLVRNFYLRRAQGSDTPEERFGRAVHELHATTFLSYEASWCPHVGLSNRTRRAQTVLNNDAYSDPKVRRCARLRACVCVRVCRFCVCMRRP
eukprot:355041-Chlamydomonas_euryale.AAC.17